MHLRHGATSAHQCMVVYGRVLGCITWANTGGAHRGRGKGEAGYTPCAGAELARRQRGGHSREGVLNGGWGFG